MVHLRNGSADADGYAASSAEECKSAHNAGPGQCSFDERSYKLTTFALENFKPLLKSGIELVDRLASSLVRVADDGNLRRKGWKRNTYIETLFITCMYVWSSHIAGYGSTG